MRRFMLLDDEVNVLRALQRTLREWYPESAVKVEMFTDPEQALLRMGEVKFDLIVSDYRMPQMNGIDFLRMARAIQPDAVRLVLSASTEFDTILNAINHAEIFRYIAKPWRADELCDTIDHALARHDQVVVERRLADELRCSRGDLTPQELESRRLEAEEPGITKVKWGPDGSVLLD